MSFIFSWQLSSSNSWNLVLCHFFFLGRSKREMSGLGWLLFCVVCFLKKISRTDLNFQCFFCDASLNRSCNNFLKLQFLRKIILSKTTYSKAKEELKELLLLGRKPSWEMVYVINWYVIRVGGCVLFIFM